MYNESNMKHLEERQVGNFNVLSISPLLLTNSSTSETYTRRMVIEKLIV